MKLFSWDPEKDSFLQQTRGVSFEQVQDEILKGRFKIVKNISSAHPEQQVFIVKLNDYIHGC